MTQGYNLIAVLSPGADKLLLCNRVKEPYLGLYNMVGGKIESGEDGFDAAYRELFEETGITRGDITLIHLMDFNYPLDPCYVEVYAGQLKHDVTLKEEAHPLFWSGLNEDFFNMEKYAGEGNIGHIMEHIRINKKLIIRGEKD